MGIYLQRYRVAGPLDADALATAVEARLGVVIAAPVTEARITVTAAGIAGRATLYEADGLWNLEMGVPGNPLFLEQLGGALEDLGATPVHLSTGQPKDRSVPPSRRWDDQPRLERLRRGWPGQLCFGLAYMLFELLLLLTVPIWLPVYALVNLGKRMRAA